MVAIKLIKDFKLKERWVPLVLLAAAVLAYGIMIRSLGFYWDDWEILYLSTAAETPSDIFLFPFRPLHVLIDIFTVRVLGYNPLNWHLLMLAIRYLGGLVFWLLLKELWPNKPARNAWAALLYLVYPSFLHIAMSVAYRQHFTTALVYLISVWLMARAYNLRRSGEVKRFWLALGFSLLTGLMHLFIMEYFAALELWRPLILIILIWRDVPTWRERLKKLTLFWLPYLLYTGAYVVWRLNYVQNQIDDPNQAVLLDNLRADPFNTLVIFLQNAIQDLRYLLFGSWVETISPEMVDLSSPVSLVVLVIMLAAGLGFFWLLASLVSKEFTNAVASKKSGEIILGLAGLVLGLAPAWVIGRHVFEGRYDTRFSIPALAGASLLVVALIFYLVPNQKKATAVLAILLALGIGRQIHMTNLFKWDWERQTRAYWQVYWRAPEIEPQTMLLVNKSLSSYATTYPVAYAINFMYSHGKISMSPDYWWFEIYESHLYTRVEELYAGEPVSQDFHNLSFTVPGDQALAFNIPNADEPSRCLWLLDSSDVANPLITQEMRQLALLTDLSRLGPAASALPPEEIFGPEPNPSWCYYLQKAELAVQLKDWNTVNELFAQAQQKGMNSIYGHEYLSFVAGSIAVQNWAQAANQTLTTYKLASNLRPNLCVLWENLETPPADQAAYNRAFAEVNEKLECTGD